jgi:hypothetical protein
MRREAWQRALDTQMDYHKWCSSDAGRLYNYTFFTDVLERVSDDLPSEQRRIEDAAKLMQHHIVQTLWQADTLYVTSDMLHVLMQAAHDLPEDAAFDEHILITKTGFCLFEEPITGTDRGGKTICMHGMAWDLMLSVDSHGKKEPMLMIYFLVDPNDPTDHYNQEFVPTMQVLGLGSPPVTLQHFYPARLGQTLAGVKEGEQGTKIILDTLKVFLAMQLLAQQRMGEPMVMRPDRATRKRVAKWHEGDRYITLITLRRKSAAKDNEEPQKIDWSHRWLVKGHWRRQYYPKTKTHDYVYIFGYVKGPEDKPLVVRERRVFDFRR